MAAYWFVFPTFQVDSLGKRYKVIQAGSPKQDSLLNSKLVFKDQNLSSDSFLVYSGKA